MSRPTYTRTGEPESEQENSPVEDRPCYDCARPGDGYHEGHWVCWECAGQRAADRRVDARIEKEDR